MAKIMIVEDNLVSLMELQELLLENSYDVVADALSGFESIAKAEKCMPDLILMDIELPGRMDGITAARIIKENLNIPIIFLTGHSEMEILRRAGRISPHGFILKPYNGPQITAAIEIALKSHKNQKRQSSSDPGSGEVFSPLKYFYDNGHALTISELKIAELVSEGLRTKEIAEHLDISRHTVSWHRKNIRSKLNLGKKNENLQQALRALLDLT